MQRWVTDLLHLSLNFISTLLSKISKVSHLFHSHLLSFHSHYSFDTTDIVSLLTSLEFPNIPVRIKQYKAFHNMAVRTMFSDGYSLGVGRDLQVFTDFFQQFKLLCWFFYELFRMEKFFHLNLLYYIILKMLCGSSDTIFI